MILWHGNFKLDDATIDMMASQVKSKKCYDEYAKHFSSYHLSDRPESILTNFYDEVVNHALHNLTLSDRINYRQSFWMQIYPNGSKGHGQHDHFTGNEIISWVHFLRPITKSFYFIVGNEKVYPETQNVGDFIVFPPWALHAVDFNNSMDERVVIAGNVMIDDITVKYRNGTTKKSICHTINHDIVLWENKD